jgi:hypothetical protein
MTLSFMPGVYLPDGHAHKGDAVAVVGVHVGLHLEYHAAEGLVLGLHLFDDRLLVDDERAGARTRRRGQVYQRIEHLHHTKVVHARAKEHRGLACPSRKA